MVEYPFLTRFPRGGYEYFAKVPRGVSISYPHPKKKMPLWRNSPGLPRCTFPAIRPCCYEKLLAPWGGGYPRAVCIFYGHFFRNSKQSLNKTLKPFHVAFSNHTLYGNGNHFLESLRSAPPHYLFSDFVRSFLTSISRQIKNL